MGNDKDDFTAIVRAQTELVGTAFRVKLDSEGGFVLPEVSTRYKHRKETRYRLLRLVAYALQALAMRLIGMAQKLYQMSCEEETWYPAAMLRKRESEIKRTGE